MHLFTSLVTSWKTTSIWVICLKRKFLYYKSENFINLALLWKARKILCSSECRHPSNVGKILCKERIENKIKTDKNWFHFCNSLSNAITTSLPLEMFLLWMVLKELYGTDLMDAGWDSVHTWHFTSSNWRVDFYLCCLCNLAFLCILRWR